jgi:hypothetical protein
VAVKREEIYAQTSLLQCSRHLLLAYRFIRGQQGKNVLAIPLLFRYYSAVVPLLFRYRA